MHRCQEKTEECVDQCDPGESLVLDLTCILNFVVSAAAIPAVQHPVDNDKHKPGKHPGELGVVPRRDRHVEAAPQHAGFGNIRGGHLRDASVRVRPLDCIPLTTWRRHRDGFDVADILPGCATGRVALW